MTDNLEEIAELFEVSSMAKSTGVRVSGQKYWRRVADGGREKASEINTRRAWLDENKRPKPTLPAVKWLDRPDP